MHPDLLRRESMEQLFRAEQTSTSSNAALGYRQPKYIKRRLFNTNLRRQDDETFIE